MEPGEKLNDQELAEWLGISRTPVREALARLEQTGLIQTFPGKETVVSEIDPTSTTDAARVAATLHALAAHDAATAITADDISAMRAANQRFRDALDRGDVPAAIEADDAFHHVAIERAGNTVLVNTLGHVMPLLRRAEHLRFDSLISRDSVAQHEDILTALARHDAEAAEAATRANWLTLRA